MLRIDHENYIKAGIEYVDGKYNLSVVVTHQTGASSLLTNLRHISESKPSEDLMRWRYSTHSTTSITH